MIEDIFLPDGFKALMRVEIGDERAEKLFSALHGEPETSLRINRRKRPESHLYPDMAPIPWCESGSYLNVRPSFTLNPLLHAGVFYVQDASSMIYESIVDSLTDGKPIIACDLCAAPGGKTTAILNALPAGSVMLANEFSPQRANILKENLCKYGYPDLIVTNSSIDRLAELKGRFDLVAVDAPCSGEGMMRKEEGARSQWSEGLIRQCVSLQREILTNAAEMLAPGGYLIYSTCTFNTSENEDNAAWIAGHSGLDPVDTGLSGRDGIQGEIKGDIPCLRFMPGFTRGEGLFVTVLRKPLIEGETKRVFKQRKKGKKEGKGNKDSGIMTLAKSWIKGDFEILNHEDRLLGLSPGTAAILHSLPKGTRIMAAGIEIGEIKGKDLVPAHALCMSTAMAHPFPEVELSTDKALVFLSKETITIPEDIPKGYVTVTYQGFPLGFIKNLGNRANNLYPSDWRIRSVNLEL